MTPDLVRPYLEQKAKYYEIIDYIDTLALPVEAKSNASLAKTLVSISSGFDGFVLEYMDDNNLNELCKNLDEVLDILVYDSRSSTEPVLILAGLYKGLEYLNKSIEDVKIVISDRVYLYLRLVDLFIAAGFKKFTVLKEGKILSPMEDDLGDKDRILAGAINPELTQGGIEEALEDADIFISIDEEDLSSHLLDKMNKPRLVFNLNKKIDPKNLDSIDGPLIISTDENKDICLSPDPLTPAIIHGLLIAQAKVFKTEMMLGVASLIGQKIDTKDLEDESYMLGLMDEDMYEEISSLIVKYAK